MNKKDIDELLELFRQLSKSIVSDPPERNKELWEQCLKQAKDELIKELKERESQLTVRRAPLRKVSREKERQIQKAFEYNINKKAEKKYREVDTKYDQTLLQIERRRAELIKEIDHILYSLKEPLLKFERAQGTLLAADWRQLRDELSADDFMQLQAQGLIEGAIDALEAINQKTERHKRKVSKSISGVFWKFYEKTIKAFFDSILDNFKPS